MRKNIKNSLRVTAEKETVPHQSGGEKDINREYEEKQEASWEKGRSRAKHEKRRGCSNVIPPTRVCRQTPLALKAKISLSILHTAYSLACIKERSQKKVSKQC